MSDILWRVFNILTESVPYTSVSVNWRNNEAWAHIAIIPPIYGYNAYGTGSVEIWKTRHKISVDIRIFLQCSKTDIAPSVIEGWHFGETFSMPPRCRSVQRTILTLLCPNPI